MGTNPNTLDTPLTDLQRRFVEEILSDPSPTPNLTQAAKRAGYSPASSGYTGSMLMKDPRIQAELSKATNRAVSMTGITKERILLELAKIGFSNIGDVLTMDPVSKRLLVDPDKLTRDTTASLQELSVTTGSRGTTVKVKQSDKQGALIAMGKHIGMFKDQLEISGNISLSKLIEDSFATSLLPNPDSQSLPVLEGDYTEVSRFEDPTEVLIPEHDDSYQLELPF